MTSEVKFGLWPHLGGLIEYFSNSSLTIHNFLIPTNFWPFFPFQVFPVRQVPHHYHPPFCINVNKNVKEKLSFGFWVSKIKTDTAGACLPNSWCKHPPPPSLIGLTRFYDYFGLRQRIKQTNSMIKQLQQKENISIFHLLRLVYSQILTWLKLLGKLNP